MSGGSWREWFTYRCDGQDGEAIQRVNDRTIKDRIRLVRTNAFELVNYWEVPTAKCRSGGKSQSMLDSNISRAQRLLFSYLDFKIFLFISFLMSVFFSNCCLQSGDTVDASCRFHHNLSLQQGIMPNCVYKYILEKFKSLKKNHLLKNTITKYF